MYLERQLCNSQELWGSEIMVPWLCVHFISQHCQIDTEMPLEGSYLLCSNGFENETPAVFSICSLKAAI